MTYNGKTKRLEHILRMLATILQNLLFSVSGLESLLWKQRSFSIDLQSHSGAITLMTSIIGIFVFI